MTEAKSKPMTVIGLTVSNVKAIKAVELRPDGSPVITIGGQNGQGKSSLLDAIAMALGGRRLQPPRPIRDGASRAEVVLDLGDLEVRRTFTASGGGTLQVVAKDGSKLRTPQALLDRLTGELTFDPLAFARARPAEQVETLQRLTGVDVGIFDRKRAELYEERTAVNREAKRLRARAGEMTVSRDAPAEPVDVRAVLEELARRREMLGQNQAHRQSLLRVEAELEAFEQRIEGAARALEEVRKLGAAKAEELMALKKVELVDPELEELEEQVARASELNRAVEQNRQASRALEEAETAEREALAMTQAIDDCDRAKAAAIAAAKLPVKGLSFGAEGVTFRGVPFEQCSSAEQLKVSVALGLALNPEIRILLIRDGSLLDEQSMATIAKLAERARAQVWVERVGAGEEVAIVISHGVVAEDRTKKTEVA